MWNSFPKTVVKTTIGIAVESKMARLRSGLRSELNRFPACILTKTYTTVWDYSLRYGPERWSEYWKGGNYQSPVDIITKEVEHDPSLSKRALTFSRRDAPLQLQNTGKTILISPQGISTKLYIGRGPLEHAYEFAQFHFHWGKTNCCGAEHHVDGHQYSGELHLVHWNTFKYKSFNDSLKYRDGLCVLAVLLELEVGTGHSELETLTRLFKNVEYKHQTFDLEEDFNPYALLPNNITDYWTYQGSLTTPPLTESAIWVVFREPIPVSQAQLDEFRDLKAVAFKDKDKEDIHDPMDAIIEHVGPGPPITGNNFRNPMPLNSRIIRSSFLPD